MSDIQLKDIFIKLDELSQKIELTHQIDKRIDIKMVKEIFGFKSDSKIWDGIKNNTIPKPIISGKKYTRWSLLEVLEYEKRGRVCS